MLETRGYYLSPEMKTLSKEVFEERYSAGPIILVVPKKDSTEKIMAYMIHDDSKNISKTVVEMVAKKLIEHEVKNGIMMSNCPMSSTALSKMNELDSIDQLHLEYFQFKELLVNITKHKLVPDH